MAGAKAGVVEKLLATLVDDGMLIDHSKEDEEHLNSKEREAFGSQIEFLEHLTDEPCRSFKRFRDANLLLTGSGFPLAALACSLIRNGARNLAVDRDASIGEWGANVFGIAAEMRAKGLECNICDGPLPTHPGHQSETPKDAVCYASDAANINRLLQINRWCRSRQTLLIPGIMLGDAFHVGPIVSESNDVCWECALLRYTDQCSAAEARDLWQQAAFDATSTAHPWPDSSPAMRIFANNLGFEVFRHFTGLAADCGSILSLDIMTLETKTTQIFTHPKCRACAERNRSTARAVLSERQFSQEPLEAWNEKLQVITPLTDKHFGIFNAFEDDHIVQTPLFRSTLLTSQRKNHVESARILATSLENNAAARIAGLFEAAGSYALAMRSPDRILSIPDLKQQSINPICEDRLTGYMGGSREGARNGTSGWVTGRSLRNGATWAVPCGAVFPAARNEAVFFEPTRTGVGCGFSATEASIKAIQSLLAFETLKSVAQGEAILRRCRLNKFTADKYALNCLGILDVDFDVWGLDLDSFALALAARRGGGESRSPIAVGYGTTLSQSVAMATRELLAVELGDGSWASLDSLLPSELGYHLPPLQGDDHDWIDVVEEERANPLADLDRSLESRMQDVIVCDITPRDLATNRLFVMKAIMAKGDRN